MEKTTTTLKIEGMSCAHCVRAVREALVDVDGVDVEDVEVGAARVTYDASRTEPRALRAAVEEAGFTVVG